MSKYRVLLHVYDLSLGMASQYSLMFTGQHFAGIWHTGIVVYGKEYFFGGGVQIMDAGCTPYGTPVKTEDLGETSKEKNEFDSFVIEQGRNRFRPDQYHLTNNNCNNFTDVCAQFLVGKSIPDYIKNLPTEFLNTPIGQMVRPIIDSMMGSSSTPMQVPNMGGMGGLDQNSLMQMLQNPQMQNTMSQMMQHFGMGSMNNGWGQYSASQSKPPEPTLKREPEFVDDKSTFRYLKANVPQVISKLKSTLKSQQNYTYTEQDDIILGQIEKFLSNTDDLDTLRSMTPKAFDQLKKYISFIPEKAIFPVLDIYRLLLISPAVISQQVQDSNSVLYSILATYLPMKANWKNLSMPTQLMLIRMFANLVGRSSIPKFDPTNDGVQFLLSSDNDRFGLIVEVITQTMTSELEGLRSCAAALAANLALCLQHDLSSDEEIQIVSSMIEYINSEKSDEVAYRMALTIYRFVYANENAREIVKVLEPSFSNIENKDNCKAIIKGIKKLLL